MINKNDLLINTNGYVLNLLEKILNANIEIRGVENIPSSNGKMFVANHFTRTEAMLTPYALYNLTNKKVGVIADDSLFQSYFGNFLENLGAMKKSEPSRNKHIISNLLKADKNWMIFPEGMMVKAKDIEKIDNNFCVKINGTCQRIYTGAIYFSLYSQLLREEHFNSKIKNNKKFKRKYFINDLNEISEEETLIVPINISYTKLRNGSNFLYEMALKLIDLKEEKFKEELDIESNLILNSKMIFQILKPISTKEILKNSNYKQKNLSQRINSIRYEVTHKIMNKIYESTTINFDHVFVLSLFFHPSKTLKLRNLKRIIYLLINEIKNADFFYEFENENDLIYLVSYEKFQDFEEILQIAIKDKILEKKDETSKDYFLNKTKLLNSYTHDTIRIKNILRVILNEVLVNEKLIKLSKKIFELNENQINEKLLNILKHNEEENFLTSRKKYKELANLKNYEIGKATYLKASSDICVICVHGFSSTPKEMEQLGLYLNQNNLNVSIIRLAGHGTCPEDLKIKKWEDWYKSLCTEITIASLQYKKIYIVGFSTGGLLALQSTKKCFEGFEGIVCINAALNLNDIRMKTLLPAVSFWNDLVHAFNEDKYAYDYINNNAENPEINYDRYYIESIKQLSLLMNKTKKRLEKNKKPTLIIQGKEDPVVNPSSAYEIYENIKSENKKLEIVEASNHVIVKGNNSSCIAECILKFIKN